MCLEDSEEEERPGERLVVLEPQLIARRPRVGGWRGISFASRLSAVAGRGRGVGGARRQARRAKDGGAACGTSGAGREG